MWCGLVRLRRLSPQIGGASAHHRYRYRGPTQPTAPAGAAGAVELDANLIRVGYEAGTSTVTQSSRTWPFECAGSGWSDTYDSICMT